MKKIFTLFVLIISFTTASAQIVNIPDANFKNTLLNHYIKIDTNNDGQIQVSEAENFTGLLRCNDSGIQDLKGIEAFVNLTELYCFDNPLKTLDISKNIKLVNLWCESNQLTNLDLSNNVLLKRVDCGKNQLKTLDISKNTILEGLHYNENQIPSFDYSKYPQLKSINCSSNGVKSIDISKNINLTGLNCSLNQLTTLDISKNLWLRILDFSSNQISTLDVSKHTDLINLSGGNNLLESVDVSKNTKLIGLSVTGNQLKSLNLKNGQNDKIEYFISYGNPNLFCIQVDDINYSNSHMPLKDIWTTYNTNCNYMSVNDIKKPEIQLYPNPAKNLFIIHTNDKIKQVEIYSLTGQILKTGHSKEINISDLPKGNYIVNVKTDKNGYSQKLIKE